MNNKKVKLVDTIELGTDNYLIKQFVLNKIEKYK